jgi:hypothetical protein
VKHNCSQKEGPFADERASAGGDDGLRKAWMGPRCAIEGEGGGGCGYSPWWDGCEGVSATCNKLEGPDNLEEAGSSG